MDVRSPYTVKVYQGRFIAVKLKLNPAAFFPAYSGKCPNEHVDKAEINVRIVA
jgi:hypothetical protein